MIAYCLAIFVICLPSYLSLPLEDFYPYDVAEDSTLASSDSDSALVNLTTAFIIFGKTYHSVYVSSKVTKDLASDATF